ncbi:Kinesin protein [Fasciolopsis buskii]|uniref:Kinesin-like protein n=1 Tax=Fasciolopsis buskii TaxID=27845 RepID=A0A8E0VH44_9TREM|nr:Kinesin protein [Fasciolopsis buski]
MSQQNIKVAVRCRPLNKSETEKGALNCIDCSREKVTVKERTSSKVFTFDYVFGPYSKQVDLYNTMVAPLVEEILTGYNCTIFAYGQTGSGKTFTMTGERSDRLRFAWEDDPLVGVIPRSLSHLFGTLSKTNLDFSVRVSFLEVYNEELFDLLSSTETNRLVIYDDVNRKGSVVVKGLREIGVLDKDEVYSVIEKGLARRQTASTLLNAQSSRSHSIFTVIVHIKEIHPTTGEELLRIGKLHLVDLAGSECIGRSGAIDKRAREAGSINQSLLTLGRVITALVDHAPHIPYRESKLTRLLQDSLGGKTKTSIIATISPSSVCLEETLSTLEYAHRAKNIQNRPEINAKLTKTDLVRCYNVELERLRRDLEAARTKTGIFLAEENYKALQAQLEQQRARINDLEERREILEYDLNQLQEMFTLAQTELEESRECRNAIENELIACQLNLEKLHVRLIKTRFRLEEEEFLRRAHQKTESTLREQAECLLSTSKTVINDVSSLHRKLDKLAQEVLKKQFTDRIASEWLDAAQKLREFVADQTNSTQRSCEEIFLPYCERVKKMCDQFFVHVDAMRGIVATNHDLSMEFSGRVSGMIDRLGQYASECTESLVAQNEFHTKIIERWNRYCARDDSVRQNILSALDELSEERQQLSMKFEECRGLSADACQNCVRKLSDAKLELTLAKKQAEENEQKAQETHCSRLLELHNHVDSLSSIHEEFKSKIAIFLDSIRRNALQFADVGLGNVLRLRVSEWNPGNVSDIHEGASAEFYKLINSTKQSVLDLIDKTAKDSLKTENLFDEQPSKELADIRDSLARFSTRLLDRLCEVLQEYQPTGETPQRQTFNIPLELARTNSHDQLLTQFRSDRQTRGLEEVSVTPLPDTNSSFGDSSQTNPLQRISDPVDLLSVEDKENRICTSDLNNSQMPKSNADTPFKLAERHVHRTRR